MNTMEELREILEEINDEVDYDTCGDLIEEGILSSFEMVMLVAEISQRLGVNIPPDQIVPENFRSAQTICALIERVAEEE